jgi:hypothetical protein
MNCKRIKDLLDAYIDNELVPELKERITEHLSRCKGCREELISMQRYTEVMVTLERKKAPEDFLERVHQRLDQTSLLQQVIEKLFLPMRIKIPLEAAGVIASVVIIILLLNPSEPVKDTEHFADQVRREDRLKVRKIPERIASRSPVVSEKPALPAKELGMIARAKLKTRTKDLEKADTYKITLLIKPELLLRDTPDLSEKDKLSSMAAGEKRRGEVLDESLEKEEFKQKKSRKSIAEERKDSPSEPLIETMNRIKRMTSSLEGRVIKEEYNNKTNLPEAVTLEIPTRNYRVFMDRLNQLGSIQERHTSIPLKKSEAAKLRIELAQ